MNVETVINKITEEIKKNIDTAVVGLSGGADSFLVMLLCETALGKENVYAYSMPYSETDIQTFNSKSKTYAEHIGVNHKTINIGNTANALTASVAEAAGLEISTLNAGNSRARARMSILYGVAHHLNEKLKNRVRVMGTGNLSEDFIGYDTKGGDALADIFPIGQLFKSEVYRLLDYFRDQGKITEEMINRVPSAGLWEDQTDEDELGHSYNEMEPAIRFILKNYKKIETVTLSEIEMFVWNRHIANKHKHEAAQVIILRNDAGEMLYNTVPQKKWTLS